MLGFAPVARADAFLDPNAAITRVFELCDERLALMPEVAAAKWQTHAPVTDPVREDAVIERAVTRGTELGLAPEGIRALFALQIRLARELEQRRVERWAHNGYDGPTPARDLPAELRPRLDVLSAELLEALYLAMPTLETLETGGLDATLTEIARARLPAPDWTAGSRGELSRAVSALRRIPVPRLERVYASGLLRIGTTGDYAPFSLEARGELEGADIELGKAIAVRLGLRPVFVRTRWDTLIADLAADRFDLALGGVSVTPPRAAAGMFTAPYEQGGKTLIARCRDRARFASLAAVDRPSVRVVVNPGGTNQDFVREHIRHATVSVHPDNRTIFDDLLSGRADVMVTDDVEVELETRREPALCRTFPGVLTHSVKAILVARDAAWHARVNAALAAEIAAGHPKRLLAHYLQQAAFASPDHAP
jgi:cyclohexadienyl dehydratase